MADFEWSRVGRVGRAQDFRELMRRRIDEILLVASPYDSFILEEDGALNERILGEFLDLGLRHVPGLTRVSSGAEALARVREGRRFNLVISAIQVGDMNAVELARRMRSVDPDMPVVLLAHEQRELSEFLAHSDVSLIERAFLWQGDVRILLAISKYVEDKLNAPHDCGVCGVPLILNQTQCLNEPVLTQPWEDVYNHVTAVAARPIRKQPSVIYFLPGPVQLSAGVPLVIDVDYQSAFDLQVSEYKAWSDKTGIGTEYTSGLMIAPSLGYNGGSVTVTSSNNAWVTKLEIRGRSWGIVDERKLSEDATSQTTYGLRRFLLDSPFLQDPNYPANHAGVIKTFAKDDRESVIVQIKGREDLQFQFDLLTKVTSTTRSDGSKRTAGRRSASTVRRQASRSHSRTSSRARRAGTTSTPR